MTYYHGRGKSRPYFGNYIYITSSPEYAGAYSDDGFIFECELLIPKDKIFSTKNPTHKQLLKDLIPKEVFNKLPSNQELDWAELNYLCSDDFDTAEELLSSLGFQGVALQERTNIDSFYIFDQNNVFLGRKIRY